MSDELQSKLADLESRLDRQEEKAQLALIIAIALGGCAILITLFGVVGVFLSAALACISILVCLIAIIGRGLWQRRSGRSRERRPLTGGAGERTS